MIVPRASSCVIAAACLVLAASSPLRLGTRASNAPQQPAPRERPSATTTGTASISGRVLVRGTLTPVPVRRARVTLSGEAVGEARTTDTDTDGRYRFDRLPAGAYRLKAEKPGFVGLEFGASRPFVPPEPLALADGETRAADIFLPRGAALEGRIVGEDGEPVQDATASAVRLGYGPRGRRTIPVGQARTDDLGRFRVHSLPAGTYYVQTVPSMRAALDKPATPGERSTGPATTYYPGTARVDEAATVTVGTGQEVGQLDFTVIALPMARLAVQVLDASGQRPASASCRVRPVAAINSPVSGFGDPRTPNICQYPAVPPGEYWVTGVAIPAAGGVPEFGAARLTVTGDDVPAVTVRTERGARVEGVVNVDPETKASAPSGLKVTAYESSFELPSLPGPADSVDSAVAVTNGRFTIPSLFGPRILRLSGLPPGWGLQAVWLDEQDITDAAVVFRASDTPHTLRLVVTNRTGSIAGTVTDDHRRPAAEARIVVFSADEHQWGPWSRSVRTATSTAGGRFAIDSLLPGNYFVCAVEDLDEDAWTDRAVLQRLRAIASPMAVAVSRREAIALTLRVFR